VAELLDVPERSAELTARERVERFQAAIDRPPKIRVAAEAAAGVKAVTAAIDTTDAAAPQTDVPATSDAAAAPGTPAAPETHWSGTGEGEGEGEGQREGEAEVQAQG